ncbi:hypothetical protein VC83_07951 [Pseudogymnoascus destructans]|uniref:Uncharacterized protein n=2 Tax=Pseudogymnoascus destructans TaxID=655981 RepID=L8GB64_PSED2|nr:uncharacterized protein VC83_07951 [Pseudogymnoascus destructans]ELR10322.1 hypothetical protein GMDG_04704 [Pseudogymnoascus destructans 20631-21]OAF55933.1 hypothetical protein VC83_07951 [Pseudogymnoascus destructans]
MKKRAPESDVRAMTAANAERQATGTPNNLSETQQPATSNLVVSVSILHNDDNKIPFTSSLDNGSKLLASITITSGQTDKPVALYIAGVELVDMNAPEEVPQQLLQNTADCLVYPVMDTCNMDNRNLQYFNNKPIPLGLFLTNTKLLPRHRYNFNLRYSQEQSPAVNALWNTTAADGGKDLSLWVSPDVSSSVSARPTASPTSSSTTTASELLKALATDGTSNPSSTLSPGSTATPTSPPASAFPSGLSSGLTMPSAPSNKGLSTGAKAGIGVGVAAAVLIVIALLVAWWVRRTRRASTRNGRGGGAGEKESVLAAAAPGGAGEYRYADEAGGGVVVGGSPVTRKPVGVPVANEAALADAVSPASTTVGVVGGAQRRGAGGEGAAQESMLNAEERERWEEEERRLDEDIAEAERRRLGA